MRDVVIGWVGVVLFVVAVLVTVAADAFSQRDEVPLSDPTDPVAPRQPGGRVFWLVVASVVVTVIAAAITVVRLTTLA